MQKFIANISPRCRLLPALICLTSFVLTSCQSAPQNSASPVAASAPLAKFEFHSSFWVNLHHYLYNEAFRADKAHQTIPRMTHSEKQQVAGAVKFYREKFAGLDLIFDESLHKINSELSRADNGGDIESLDVPDDVKNALAAAAPVYKSHLWRRQDHENHLWIEDAEALLRKYGGEVEADLENVLHHKFGDSPYVIDVVHEANWAGAYTYTPPHTVISSGRPSYAGYAALEMIFHETLHAGPFNKIQSALDSEFSRLKQKDRGDLWHAILFFTAGQATQDVLVRHGIAYTPYADKNSLFAPGRTWGNIAPLLAQYWQPYMRGEVGLPDAVANVVTKALISPAADLR